MTIPSATTNDFLRLLTFRRDGEAFVTQPGGASPAGVMYGGMPAQVLMVGAALTELLLPESLHVLFLRPGDVTKSVTYETQVLRETRSIASFRITGHQEAGPLVEGTVSLQPPEEGIAHQPEPMPPAPALEATSPFWRVMGAPGPHPCWSHQPLELRGVEPPPTSAHGDAPIFQWLARPVAPLPDDLRIHAAALVHISDQVSAPLARYYGVLGKQVSLDHAVWFHGEVRCDDWMLFHSNSPRAAQGRALLAGGVYQTDGTLLMSVLQEALFRS